MLTHLFLGSVEQLSRELACDVDVTPFQKRLISESLGRRKLSRVRVCVCVCVCVCPCKGVLLRVRRLRW